MSGRSNSGASEEYRIIATNLHDPYHFHDFIQNYSLNSIDSLTYVHLGQEVVFGKKLINAYQHFLDERVSLVDVNFLLPSRPQKLYHFDSSETKRVESLLSHPEGSLKDCKADLIAISETEGLRFYSVKKGGDIKKKSGQISGFRQFGSAVLGGVDALKDFQPKTPHHSDILWGDTSLKKTSFESLKERKNVRNIELAWFKKHSLAWKHIVKLVRLDAETMLKNFWEDIERDRESFVAFIIYLLMGPNVKIGSTFHIFIGGRFYSLNDFHKFLLQGDYQYYCEWYKESSLILYLCYLNKIYVLTKLQYSFDGARVDKSQTKGIVFYAQDYSSRSRLGLWDLLEDIPKNVS